MNSIEKLYQLESGQLVTEKQLETRWIRSNLAPGETIESIKKKEKPFEENKKDLMDKEGVKDIFLKLRSSQPNLTQQDGETLAKLVDGFTTVSLSPAEVGEDVARIAEEVNKHSHTMTCRKHGGTCRFGFPRFPSNITLIAGPHLENETDEDVIKARAMLFGISPGFPEDKDKNSQEDEEGEKPRKGIKQLLREACDKALKKVKAVLDSDEQIQTINKAHPKKGDTAQEYKNLRAKRIKLLLKKAGVREDLYHYALGLNRKGYTVVQKRDLDEVMINSYNPTWLKAWDGNIDVSFCFDFFAVITYITEYLEKQENMTMAAIKSVLDSNPDDSTKEKMKKVANAFMRSRQVGEAEGFYKILPDLLLKNSNQACQWLSLEDPGKKVKRMLRADETVKEANNIYKEVEGKEGLWKEQPDMVTKWLRRQSFDEEDTEEVESAFADPSDICLAHFAKMYTPSWSNKPNYGDRNIQSEDIAPEADENEEDENGKKKKKKRPSPPWEEDDNPDAKFVYLMHADPEKTDLILPSLLKIRDPLPGEPSCMRRRTHPTALRFHKTKQATNPASFFKEEIMLYSPDWTEEMFDWSDEKVFCFFAEHEDDINIVKKQVMEYLEDVQEARFFVEEANKELNLEETAALVDPQNEQEDADLEGESQLDPALEHLDPGPEGTDACTSTPRLFRQIDVPDWKVLKEKTMSLDPYQRLVVDIAIKYARDIRKTENTIIRNPMPKPPHLMVHGGAGAGKTTVIKTVVQHVERILRRSGDASEQPYVLLCAATGAAASLIEGITLHKAFNFDFSGKHFSLSDKIRDTKRTQLKNLRILIIDEVSMVKSDMLYQIDLRLQEVKERPNVPFGGVVLMCFGDIMQLPPVRASYIFTKPKGENFHVVFDLASRWHMLKVINLEVNHRQDGDKMYADLLNRMRKGEHTEEDMKELKKRIRKKGHQDFDDVYMYIMCRRATTQEINSEYIKKHQGEEIELKAIHSHAMQKRYKPKIDEEGEVGQTGFMDVLKVKIGVQVMLLHNTDVTDCLSNGQLGKLVAVIKAKDGAVTKLMVSFNNKNVGKEWRQKNPGLASRYPGCSGIDRVSMSYSLKEKAAKNITIIQYPLKLAKAVTSHKIQGQSITKPLKVAMEINRTFSPAQAYVMFSRVEDINQIIIIDSLKEGDIKTSRGALLELENMTKRSLNSNPTSWMSKHPQNIKIAHLNIMNLKNNMRYVVEDPTLIKADIICLTETWMETTEDENRLSNIPGFEASFNSAGKGRGTAAFFRCETFTAQEDLNKKLPDAQISMFTSEKVDVILVYRSQGQQEENILTELKNMINTEKTTVVCGDLNICLKKDPDNIIITTMAAWDFEQLNKEASHVAGGHLDHMYLTRDTALEGTLERYTPFFSDHDAHCLTLQPKVRSKEFYPS